MSKGKPLDRDAERGPPTARDSLAFLYQNSMKKILSVFCDESGDSGFSSKKPQDFYIVSLVFHNQKDDISSQLNRFSNSPVFHTGPLIRREDEYKELDLKARQKLLNNILILTSVLPIKQKTFVYEKKDFDGDKHKLQLRMFKDMKSFLLDYNSFFSEFDEIIVYYDGGQQIVSHTLNLAFGDTGYPVRFKEEVKPENYRLFQVADFISTIMLISAKYNKYNNLSKSELSMMDERHFKNLYLRTIKKKELK